MTMCKSPKVRLRSLLWPEGSEKSVWPVMHIKTDVRLQREAGTTRGKGVRGRCWAPGWRGGKVREGMPCEPLAPMTAAKMSTAGLHACKERLWAKWGVGESQKRGLLGTESGLVSESPAVH